MDGGERGEGGGGGERGEVGGRGEGGRRKVGAVLLVNKSWVSLVPMAFLTASTLYTVSAQAKEVNWTWSCDIMHVVNV